MKKKKIINKKQHTRVIVFMLVSLFAIIGIYFASTNKLSNTLRDIKIKNSKKTALAPSLVIGPKDGLPFNKSIVDLVVDDSTPSPSRMVKSKEPFKGSGVIAGKIMGGDNAKITIELFEDFECVFCLQHTNTISQILDTYGKNINLVIKHYPLPDNQNAIKAAQAYECAREQGKGWEMHDMIFDAADKNEMSVQTWKSDAIKLELDTEDFAQCIDNNKYATKITDDIDEALKIRVRGAPSTVVNNEIVKGAVSYETLDAVVKKYL